MQLVAYGAQDIYLTGNPQITFFKTVYRRHTNFSIEAIDQTWDGNDGSDGRSGRCTAILSRSGDLVHRMYLEVNGGVIQAKGINNPGAIVIDEIELEIGGQTIDKQSGQWMHTWYHLSTENPNGVCGTFRGKATYDQTAYASFIPNSTLFQSMSGMAGCEVSIGDATSGNRRPMRMDEAEAGYEDLIVHIPLNFWFCKNPGLALPLIALQYHEVKIILNHRLGESVNMYSNGYDGSEVSFNIWKSGTSNTLWVDYIFLDTDERRRFAQVSHEYLIEQVQEQHLNPGKAITELSFNHPVKELVWGIDNRNVRVQAFSNGRQNIDSENGFGALPEGALPAYGNLLAPYASANPPASDLLVEVLSGDYILRLNGHDRFEKRDAKYFAETQILDHHTGTNILDPAGSGSQISSSLGGTGPRENGDDRQDKGHTYHLVAGSTNIYYGIGVYSFALKPEEHQPSGTCNFSRIDNAEFEAFSEFNLANVIYAVNYNVLRIMSGMGGLAYSN